MTRTVLIVDDEKDIRDLLAYNLSKEGFAVLTAADGIEALKMIEQHQISIVVLDIMMPGLDGYEVCRRIRANESTSRLPVLFLTAKSAEVDQIVGLELGADDYIQKPVSPRVLVARVKSAMRRSSDHHPKPAESPEAEKVTVGDLEIDKGTYRVKLAGKEVFFPRKEFELLFYLVSHPGRIFSRDAILNQVWGDGAYVVERTVDVHIFKVREKLGKMGDRIETVKGVGYRFVK
ncbi:MAG: response regulator transcription factor [Bacteroidota bacterium]|nr:response regulator transcription factor [Bacteroidota bacterium]MDP4230304.1 response regulator transcription factor [Bacteroidota bacterium]MDP4236923.1 response regulator transcription factor [Bacteroidota bacterium]